MDKLNRREFMTTTAGAGILAASRPLAGSGAPAVHVQSGVKPIIVSSANGHQFKNGGTKTCVETAWERMMRGDDVLDSLIAGVNIVELDPLEDSVGFGGVPNAEGGVQLDACCMHGPKKSAGGVGASENVKTPSLLAKAVMEKTQHVLIVGKDVTKFAKSQGFELFDDLNTPNSRAKWEAWKKSVGKLQDIADPDQREAAVRQVTLDMVKAGLINENHIHGTINCNGMNAKGEICGVTTTSGMAWKVPGRLGDSPILGAGLYVDNEIGAAGSTGRGEANLYGLCSYLIVEELRRGKSPKDAGMEACRRVKDNTLDKKLLNSRGLPNFGLNFYILNKKGEYAGVALYGTAPFAVCDAKGPRLEKCEPLLPGGPTE